MTDTELKGCLAAMLSLFGISLGGKTEVDSDLPYRLRDDFLSAAELSFYRRFAAAVSYLSCMNEATFNLEEHYPMKIGYTSGVDGALERINGQFPRALAEDARVRFIGRCDDGRTTESRIQRHLKHHGRKIDSAPGKEWFSTNAAEVKELFAKFC